MTTSDPRTVARGLGIPVSPEELAGVVLGQAHERAASQGLPAPTAASLPTASQAAADLPPGVPSPPQVPAGTSLPAPTPFAAGQVAIPAGIVGPDSPPLTVPVAPRGEAPRPGVSEVPSAAAGPRGGVGPWQPGDPVGLAGLALDLSAWAPSPTLTPPRDAPSDAGRAPGGVTRQSPSGPVPHVARHPAEEFDVASIRADFPILSERVNGHPLIWFDNAATTQKPQAVIDRLAYFYAHENSNIHRAAHTLAARATNAYEDARDAVRDFLGAARSQEIAFVRGTTEGIDLVAASWGRRNLRPGDEIVITHLEHHANIVPWQMVAQATGAVLKVAPVDDRGNLLLEGLGDLLNARTRIVAATEVANVTGTVNPVREIVELAHRAGARVLIDDAQSVPHLPVNLSELGADFFVFSGHKVYGPTGIGAVYISERVWDETPAWQGGGNMIRDVTVERSLYQGPPEKYEAGTGNIADAVGLATALRYVSSVGLDRIASYEHALLEYALPRLAAIPGVHIVGHPDHQASVVSFLLDGYEVEEVGTALNERGVAVRAGHHCAQPILRRFGLEKTVRPSFAFYNTCGEIDVFLQAVTDLSDRRRAR